MGNHDELLQVLKEKMRLEGQLESLSSEASQVRERIIKSEIRNNVKMLNYQTRIFTLSHTHKTP